MKPIYILKVSLMIIFSTIFFGFSASPGDQVTEDLKHANPDIHWPSGFSPKTADLYAHNEIMIDAPVGVVIPKGENKTFVVMEECVYGAGAKDLRQKDPAVMHRGHELWNTTLKSLSETK